MARSRPAQVQPGRGSQRRSVRRLAALGSAALLAAAAPLLVLPAAHAGAPRGSDTGYSVTFVARQCQDYPDIMANKARNNIQESLRDLGKDTVYGQSAQVSVAVEEADYDHARCKPLVGWRFQLGTGIKGKQPSTAQLSTVTGGYSTPITTESSTPLLDGQGGPTGQSVAGAVTVPLTADQAARAQSSSSLWVQGGRGSDTLNAAQFPGEYGFGALRCAVDNLNGDNVEWIAFPSRQTHVVCYYYAVRPPPDAGTIVVKKALAPGSYGPATFTYHGNISYNTDGAFQLTADAGSPGSQEFVRAASPDDVWDFAEDATPGWVFVSLTCNDPQGGSTVVYDLPNRKASVTVAPGHTLTCTYVNRQAATGPLVLEKVTEGGVGTFPFTLTTPGGANDFSGDVTTTAPGVATVVKQVPSGDPGAYSATETLPAPTSAGSWSLQSADCNGAPVTVTGTLPERTISGVIDDAESQTCTFTNLFTPAGSITISKTTHGGTGDFGFVVEQLDAATHTFTGVTSHLEARVSHEGTPTEAVLEPGDPPLTDLPVGTPTSAYLVRELEPPISDAHTWTLVSADCTGATGHFAGGEVVALTASEPHVHCAFTNRLDPTATVDLVKVVGGDGARSAPVHVVLSCTDGTKATLAGPADDPGPFRLPQPYVFRAATRCTVHETATGAADATTVATDVVVDTDGTTTTHPGTSAAFNVDLGTTTVATVHDTYTPTGSGGGGSGSGPGPAVRRTEAALRTPAARSPRRVRPVCCATPSGRSRGPPSASRSCSWRGSAGGPAERRAGSRAARRRRRGRRRAGRALVAGGDGDPRRRHHARRAARAVPLAPALARPRRPRRPARRDDRRRPRTHRPATPVAPGADRRRDRVHHRREPVRGAAPRARHPEQQPDLREPPRRPARERRGDLGDHVIAFGLWYWDLDRGGAAARAHREDRPPAFVFPEMQSKYADPAWEPTFIDYLSLAFWTATAFSPTDVSAIRPWAKSLMMVEASASLVIAALVIARAINVL